MADKFAPEAVRTLRSYGVNTRSDPTERFATAGENGRADLMIVYGGRGCFMEIKSAKMAFDLREWRENQRIWAVNHAIIESKTPVWIWLSMGENPPHYSLEKHNPRLTWIIPSWIIVDIEDKLSAFQSSLPYRVKKGMKKEVQEGRLDAITLLKDFGLEWSGNGKWRIPHTHPFYKEVIEPQPLFDLSEAATKLKPYVQATA